MHVIDPAPFGGAESVVKALSAARRALGDTPVAALVDRDDHTFVTELAAAGVDVDPIVTRHRRYLRQVRLLAERLRKRKIDCVHTHVYHADVVGYLAARRAGCAVVATYHGYVGGSWRNRFYEWGDRRLLRRFHAVVCVSEGNRRRLLASGAAVDRLHTVPNGMLPRSTLGRAEARAVLGLPLDARVVGWIGRLSAEKGPDLFVDALGRVGTPGVLAIMIGDGPEHATIEKRIAMGDLARRVRLFGHLSDAGRVLPAFDVLAISSRTEGLPRGLLEAIQAGVAVVAFAVGGLPEYLDPTNAWLAAPGQAGALAASLDAALGDAEGRSARARSAAEMAAERLSMTAWCDALERVYTAALSRHLAS